MNLWEIRNNVKGGKKDYNKKRKEISKYAFKIVDLMEDGVLKNYHFRYGGNGKIWGWFLFKKENEMRRLVAYCFMYADCYKIGVKFNLVNILPLLKQRVQFPF